MRPVDVNKSNENQIFNSVLSNTETQSDKFKLKINDKVRISKYKTVFSKGYTPNWSEEVFIITDLIARNPNVYKLKDLNNEPIEGIFYETELQKVINEDEVFKIERILKTKVRNKIKEVYVKWLGYSNKFNSWVIASDVIKK